MEHVIGVLCQPLRLQAYKRASSGIVGLQHSLTRASFSQRPDFKPLQAREGTVHRIRDSDRHRTSTSPTAIDAEQNDPAKLYPDVTKSITNPPITTLSPPLLLPEEDSSNYLVGLFQLGRAYSKFYITGLKYIWRNATAARDVRNAWNSIDHDHPSSSHIASVTRFLSRSGPYKAGEHSVFKDDMKRVPLLTRAEYQLLERSRRSILKLVPFGLFFLVFGEFSPLVIVFVPGIAPETCRIPKQKSKQHLAAAERRLASRQQLQAANSQPGRQKSESTVSKAQHDNTSRIHRLSTEELGHFCAVMNVYPAFMDQLLAYLPRSLVVKRAIMKLTAARADDELLCRDGGVAALTDMEVVKAADERGIDIPNRATQDLRNDLESWMELSLKGDEALIEEIIPRNPQ